MSNCSKAVLTQYPDNPRILAMILSNYFKSSQICATRTVTFDRTIAISNRHNNQHCQAVWPYPGGR